jgi:uncharacterized protein YjbI with pentapeptide repeats
LWQGKPLKEAKKFQKEEAGSLALSFLSVEFIEASIKHRRNHRRKLVSFGLIIPFGLAVFLGIVGATEIRKRRFWDNLITAEKQGNHTAMIQALQEMVKAGFSLAEIQLGFANLSGANLSGANLRAADLTAANLGGTNLSSANLSAANLSAADFSAANLSAANLSRAYLNQAHLSFVNLSDGNLRGADLRGADLGAANINRTDLSTANLNGTNLSMADLKDANLKKAEFGCSKNPWGEFKCTDLSGAKNLTPEQVKYAKNWEKALRLSAPLPAMFSPAHPALTQFLSAHH